MTDDETLASAPVETVDVTETQTVEDFDFESWLAGARPTRRAVKVYGRADLVAQMDEVAGGYRDDLPAARKREIAGEVERLKGEFEASGRWFVLEARSSEWQDRFRKDTAKSLGVDIASEDTPLEELTHAQVDARRVVTLHQAAAQVASPSGVTPEGLARLGEINEGELNKIIVAAVMANSKTAQSADVLTRDFSPKPSGKSGTAGSRRR